MTDDFLSIVMVHKIGKTTLGLDALEGPYLDHWTSVFGKSVFLMSPVFSLHHVTSWFIAQELVTRKCPHACTLTMIQHSADRIMTQIEQLAIYTWNIYLATFN